MARKSKNEDDERIDPFEAGTNDAAEILLEFIEAIEAEHVVILEAQERIREHMKDAGGRGYNPKTMRRVISARKAKRLNAERYISEQHEFETYMNALGLSEY